MVKIAAALGRLEAIDHLQQAFSGESRGLHFESVAGEWR
jgi:hypothetical protein